MVKSSIVVPVRGGTGTGLQMSKKMHVAVQAGSYRQIDASASRLHPIVPN